MGYQIDLKGKTFNKLKVIEYSHTYKNTGKSVWKCLCECDRIKYVQSYHLLNNKVMSCGCSRGELISKGKTKHGRTGSPIYKRWAGMTRRCRENKRYYEGVKVCNRWLSFENFYEDMNPTFKPDLFLDRIDYRGDYEPSNCRWVTPSVSSSNTSRGINYEGKTAKEASIRLGGSPSLVSMRIREGWKIQEAFSTKAGKRRNHETKAKADQERPEKTQRETPGHKTSKAKDQT